MVNLHVLAQRKLFIQMPELFLLLIKTCLISALKEHSEKTFIID